MGNAIYRMAEESAIFVKWKTEEAMLHVLTSNSDHLIFHYANEKKTSVWMCHAQDYCWYGRKPKLADYRSSILLAFCTLNLTSEVVRCTAHLKRYTAHYFRR